VIAGSSLPVKKFHTGVKKPAIEATIEPLLAPEIFAEVVEAGTRELEAGVTQFSPTRFVPLGQVYKVVETVETFAHPYHQERGCVSQASDQQPVISVEEFTFGITSPELYVLPA